MTFGRRGKSWHSWVMVVLVFYWLFTPPILGKHSSYFVAAFSWLYLFWNCKSFFRIVRINRLLGTYAVLAVFLCWAVLLGFVIGGSKVPAFHDIYWIISIVPGALCISLHTKKQGRGLEYILRLILWAALIQSVISIAAFLYNPLKLFLIDRLQADETLVMDSYTNEINYRLFGFSAGLTFDMPSAMAVIACLAVYLGARSSWKYYLFVPVIAFSAMINARTSMVILAVGVAIFILKSVKLTGRTLAMMILLPVAAAAVLVLGGNLLRQISPMTYGWVESGFQQILGFFRNETDYGYFEYLLDPDKWLIPSGIQLLFGTGYRVMGGSPFGVTSDVGYINDLWYGGILYALVIYGAAGAMLLRIRHCGEGADRKTLRYIVTLYLVILPILNLKTPILAMGPLTSLLIVVMVYNGLIRHNEKLIPGAVQI